MESTIAAEMSQLKFWLAGFILDLSVHVPERGAGVSTAAQTGWAES
jgi:hypothetical protein